ncbi:hypothetical protein [Pseudovibrio sp. Tun.PSC04-5.I4]|uniref:hypothetical protein n=1 Tax=Pseudovibrio sp. Tun.PSC04-5.I4 TaxID=1798213 RepID=UPI0008905A55|nr:hypothetical protein [Pseudovibrio sp. Tun.PSC04-5.I4]SDQ77587.1 hypothetical protein SAMN04515695_1352 [Pseudovibrio sp. Tun.PSC04-5.I4]
MLQHSNNNLFSIMELFSENYAKSYKSYCEASHKVMPFMKTSETRGKTPEKPQSNGIPAPFMKWVDPSAWQTASSIPQMPAMPEMMNWFSGDNKLGAAMASHFRRKDAMNAESWFELMPVLLVLQQGNMMKQYLAGPQRTMLEAFLQGFAKGCPELHQNSDDVRNPILDAREAFWSQMMPLTNPMIEFWTEAMQQQESTAKGHSVSKSQELAASSPKKNSQTKPKNQPQTQLPHMPGLADGFSAVQQAQADAWQTYCKAFWPQ